MKLEPIWIAVFSLLYAGMLACVIAIAWIITHPEDFTDKQDDYRRNEKAL